MMIEQALELLRGMAAVGLMPLVAVGMWSDLGGAGMIGLSFFAIAIVSFALHYILTRRVMRAGGLLADDAPGDVSGVFLVNLVSNIGITLGFVLLIVPGIWLLARWFAAVPILFAEKLTPSEAMAANAARTRPMLGPIILAVAIVYVPSVAAVVASILWTEYDIVLPGVSFAINIGSTVSHIAGWYPLIAIYRATWPEPVEAVFA